MRPYHSANAAQSGKVEMRRRGCWPGGARTDSWQGENLAGCFVLIAYRLLLRLGDCVRVKPKQLPPGGRTSAIQEGHPPERRGLGNVKAPVTLGSEVRIWINSSRSPAM